MTMTIEPTPGVEPESKAPKTAAAVIQADAEAIEDSLTFVHLRQVTRSESGDTRWRAEIVGKGSGQWMTLYTRDIQLLVACQTGSSTDYGKLVHLYRLEDQPSVGIIETDGIYNLYSVYLGNRYLTHSEGEKLMAESKSPAAPNKVMTIEDVRASVDNAFNTRKEVRKKQRPTDAALFSPEDERRENAEALLDVSLHVDNQQDRLGKLQLATLWRLRSGGDFRAMPEKPQNIADIVRRQQYKNRDYVLSLALVVDRVFPQVDALLNAGTPFTNPTNGQPVTVEDLIIGDGLINKLTKSSALFEKLIDLDKRRTLIGAIVTKTRDEVAALRDELGKVLVSNVTSEPGNGTQNGSGTSDLISVLIEPIPSSQAGMPRKRRLVLDDLDDAQFMAITTILKPLIGAIAQ